MTVTNVGLGLGLVVSKSLRHIQYSAHYSIFALPAVALTDFTVYQQHVSTDVTCVLVKFFSNYNHLINSA